MSVQTTGVVDILLVEDNTADARLMQEALSDARINGRLRVARDGEEAIAFLRQQAPFAGAYRPDLILLDLNLPRKNGRDVLAEIKADDSLQSIPVVVLTTSQAGQDIHHAYQLHVNCYIVKPVDLEEFFSLMKTIEHYWFQTARLPREAE